MGDTIETFNLTTLLDCYKKKKATGDGVDILF